MICLIANRAEVACRISRALRNLGYSPVGVFEEGDHSHLSSLDRAIKVSSYMNPDGIIDAAKTLGANAVHPGYGFLSESAVFTTKVEKAKLTFIGPSSSVIEKLGDKAKAKELAKKAGLKTPDSIIIKSPSSKTPKLPVILKITGAGGGRGTAVVEKKSELSTTIERLLKERDRSFPGSEVIAEQYIKPARHIEVQLAGDKHGCVGHLFERECSAQRRRQKLLELAPAPGLSRGVLEKLFSKCCKLGELAKLDSLSTAEFLFDGEEFYFIEVNPRLQVEHTITEEVTGVDLVELQIKLALGEKLSLANVRLSGFSMQARICAEDPHDDFSPQYGTISSVKLPGLPTRVEAPELADFEVSPSYDTLLLKLIAHSGEYSSCTRLLLNAIRELKIEGIRTNQSIFESLLTADEQIFTHSLDEQKGFGNQKANTADLIKYLCHGYSESSFRSSKRPDGLYEINSLPAILRLNNSDYSCRLLAWGKDGKFEALINEKIVSGKLLESGVLTDGLFSPFSRAEVSPRTSEANIISEQDSQTKAPITGQVVQVLKCANENVVKGELLFVVESMKMEYQVLAGRDGKLSELFYKQGEQVEKGSLMCEIL